jgi:dienelactone hydrolase
VSVIVALFTAVAPFHAHAQTASRIEVHPIRTLTQTDEQFLTGSKEGEPTVLAGELRIPRPGTDRLPAVVLVHGAGGIGGNIDRWAQELNGIGVAAFILDGFTGRGIASVGQDPTLLGRTLMIADSYRALELLSKHPRIDPARIAVMGFSRGGQAALYSALKRFQKMHGPQGLEFAAYVIFYGPCNLRFIDDDQVADRPIRLFHGTADDYVYVAPCRAYVKRLRAAGKDVHLTEYPGAQHVFDGPHIKAPIFQPQGITTRHCATEENPVGRIINSETGQTFSYDDPCVERGATVAYDAEAYSRALVAVKGFLTEVFQLK